MGPCASSGRPGSRPPKRRVPGARSGGPSRSCSLLPPAAPTRSWATSPARTRTRPPPQSKHRSRAAPTSPKSPGSGSHHPRCTHRARAAAPRPAQRSTGSSRTPEPRPQSNSSDYRRSTGCRFANHSGPEAPQRPKPANSLSLTAAIDGHPLAPGSYRLALTVTSNQGAPTDAKAITFQILGPGQSSACHHPRQGSGRPRSTAGRRRCD